MWEKPSKRYFECGTRETYFCRGARFAIKGQTEYGLALDINAHTIVNTKKNG